MRLLLFGALTIFAWHVTSLPLTTALPKRPRPRQAGPKLKFRPDGTFQISIFEDLHYGEGEDNPPEVGWGPISDTRSTKVINTLLDAEKPDITVINGDLITGENTYITNSTDYLDVIVAPLVTRNIPWASVYGNHDNNYNISTEKILERERTRYPQLSLTTSMISGLDEGVSNYYIPIYGSNSTGNISDIPKALLWFFDSRGGRQYQKVDENGNTMQIPGVVDESVVEWFTETNSALNTLYGRAVPSLAFVHIPVYAMTAFQKQGVDPETAPGINDDNPLVGQGIVDGEYIGTDIPFMSALLNTPGLIALFSGHDHGDDWCFKWNSKLPDMTLEGNGLVLCFGRHTGYGGYGTWTRGSRQLLLRESTIGKEEVETWIRLEDNNISGRVMLNSTYGLDRYPVVNS